MTTLRTTGRGRGTGGRTPGRRRGVPEPGPARRGSDVKSILGVGAAFLAFALPPAIGAETPTVTATASATEVTVGQVFTVELGGEGPPGTVWTFPPEVVDEKVELRAAPPASGSSATAATQRYEAAVFALGEVTVPAITVRYRLPDGREGTTASEPVSLRVASLLAKGETEPSLADIRPPVKVPAGTAFWMALTAGAALVASLVLLLARLARRKAVVSEAPPEPQTPPDEEALAALDRLASSGLLQRGEYRAFYISLADVAKRYLERRLGAPVLEMTSAEVVAFLRDSVPARDLAPLLRDLTGAADLVKFARGSGEERIAERHLAAVRSMVMSLEARLNPHPQSASAEKSA